MDIASGVISVASIAIQLVETVEKMRRFVNKVVEAPKEQQRLDRYFKLLTDYLDGVIATSKWEESNGYGATAFSDNIEKAVLNCAGELHILEGYVNKYERIINGEGKFRRMLSSVKLAFKEHDINDFENHLQQAVDFLQAVMIADIRDNQNRNKTIIIKELNGSKDMVISELNCNRDILNQIQNTLIEEFATIRANIVPAKAIEAKSSAEDDTMVYEKHKYKSTSALQVSRRQSTITTSYQSLLGTIYIRRTRIAISTNEDDDGSTNNTPTQINNSWSFFPTFLSRCVELQFHNAYSSVFRRLRTYQVIDDRDPIFNICYEGTRMDLQNYFHKNRHRISPFVVESGGRGLLYFAALGQNLDTCKVLFGLGVEPNSTIDYDGYDPMRFLAPCSPRKKGRLPEDILQLYLGIYPDMLERGVLGFWGKYNIDEFEKVVTSWVRRDNINLFDDSPIICAVRSFSCNKFPFHVERYIKITQKLVELGADLHRRAETTGLSLLHEILAEGVDPYEASRMFKFWVIVLRESGINMTSYFDVELGFYDKCSPIFIEEQVGRQRYITMAMDIFGQPHFSWDWWIDPATPGFEVLKEFRSFGPPWHDPTIEPEDDGYQWKYNFPFVYLSIHRINQPVEQSHEHITGDWDKRNPQIRLWHIRGESRRQKKADKLAKARGLDGRRLPLPGAWID